MNNYTWMFFLVIIIAGISGGLLGLGIMSILVGESYFFTILGLIGIILAFSLLFWKFHLQDTPNETNKSEEKR